MAIANDSERPAAASQAARRGRLRPRAPYLLAFLGVALLAAPLAVGALIPLGFDALTFFLPLSRMAAALGPGADLIWTDRLGLGYPLLASAQLPLCYPLFWPLLACKDPAAGVALYLAGHLLIGALGGVRLGRVNGLSRAASALLATLCGGAAPVACLLNRPEFGAAAAWLPWIFAAALQATSRGRWAAFAVSLGACVLVSPQIGLFAGVLAAVVAKVSRRRAPVTPREAVAGGLALVAMTAPLLFPLVEFLAWSDRVQSLAGRHSIRMAIEGVQLLSLLAPPALGLCEAGWSALRPACAELPSAAHSLWLAAPVAGTVATALAGLTLARSRRFRALGGVLLIALLLAMPGLVPGVRQLWSAPPLSLLRFPAKLWEACWPLCALLSAAGVDVLRRDRRRFAPWLGGGAAALVLLSLAPPAAWRTLAGALGASPAALAALDAHLTFGLWRSAALLLGSAAACRLLARRRACLAVALIAGAEALMLGAATVVGMAPPPAGRNVVAAAIKASAAGATPRVSQLWTYRNPVLAAAGALSREERLTLELGMGGYNALLGEGIALEQAYTGIDLRTYGPLADALGAALPLRTALLGADALLVGVDYQADESLREVKRWPVAGVKLLVPTKPPRRALAAREVRAFADRAALNAALPGLPPADDGTAMVVGERAAWPGAGGASMPASVSLTHDEPLRVELDTRADQSTLVWTKDTLGPGWRVQIDGGDATPVPVFGALRGVVVPAGAHRVVWRFVPASFMVGCAAALAAAIILGMTLIQARRRHA